MLTKDKLQTFKGHTPYYSCTETGSGGVALLVQDRFFHSKIELKTNLQTVAVRISVNQKKFSLCSICVPPTLDIDKYDLMNLKSQLPSPCIFMGDFNGHSNFWGASETNSRGNAVENFLLEEDMLLLNHKTLFVDPAPEAFYMVL